MILVVLQAISVDPDQTAPRGAVLLEEQFNLHPRCLLERRFKWSSRQILVAFSS